MSLALKDLACTRTGRLLFQGVTRSLAPAQTLLIQGSNGVGKTSLLESICGLRPFSHGTALLNGAPLDTCDFRFVMTKGGFKEDLSVGDHVRFWSRLYGGDSLQEYTCLEHFHLRALGKKAVRTLSAGQRQRLNLTRLFFAQARLWLLDEPFLTLDTHATQALLKAIEAHTNMGGMLLITSHTPLENLNHLVLDLDTHVPTRAHLSQSLHTQLQDAYFFS